ncbi:MAG: hypothetical protein LUE14_07860 [Clostridiales bacterium]|nr:hypothetical protein [Clostridiales bacterium]
MKVTKRFLENETKKMESIMAVAQMRAEVQEENNDLFLSVADLQGTNFAEIEDGRFYCARDVVDRLSAIFEDTYLDGEQCCDADCNFGSYQEAEAYARKNGYVEEADNIVDLMAVLSEPERVVITGTDNEKYLMEEAEMYAAYYHAEFLFRKADMQRAFERLVYGEELQDCSDAKKQELLENPPEKFAGNYGISPEEAFLLVDQATNNFLQHYDCTQGEYDQMDYWAKETIRWHVDDGCALAA